MARPIAADAALTKERILTAATRLFSESDQGEVSVRGVAAAAGITLATVHHYFGTKDQLYAACVEAMYQELQSLRGELEQVFAAGVEQPKALVDRIVRACFRFARDHRAAIRLLMRTIVDTGRMDPERFEALHLPFLAQSGQLLSVWGGANELQARLLAQSLMHLIVRYALTDDVELARVAAVDPRSARATARAEEIIADHLAQLAERSLAPPEKIESKRPRRSKS